MLIINRQGSTTGIKIKHLGYQYDNKNQTLTLPGSTVYTVTDESLDKFTLDTTESTTYESNYVVLETSIVSGFFDLQFIFNNTFYYIEVTELQAEYDFFTIKFYPIGGYNNYVVVIKNKLEEDVVLKVNKRFLKYFGNHINNVDGQLVGSSKIIDNTKHIHRNCYLVNNSDKSDIDDLLLLSEKLVSTADNEYLIFNLKGV